MVQSGWSGDLDRLTIADVPAGRLRDGLLRRRADLGLSTADLAPVCVDENGVPWPPAELTRRLRFAKAVRVSLDGNAHFCRGHWPPVTPAARRSRRSATMNYWPLTPLRSAS